MEHSILKAAPNAPNFPMKEPLDTTDNQKSLSSSSSGTPSVAKDNLPSGPVEKAKEKPPKTTAATATPPNTSSSQLLLPAGHITGGQSPSSLIGSPPPGLLAIDSHKQLSSTKDVTGKTSAAETIAQDPKILLSSGTTANLSAPSAATSPLGMAIDNGDSPSTAETIAATIHGQAKDINRQIIFAPGTSAAGNRPCPVISGIRPASVISSVVPGMEKVKPLVKTAPISLNSATTGATTVTPSQVDSRPAPAAESMPRPPALAKEKPSSTTAAKPANISSQLLLPAGPIAGGQSPSSLMCSPPPGLLAASNVTISDQSGIPRREAIDTLIEYYRRTGRIATNTTEETEGEAMGQTSPHLNFGTTMTLDAMRHQSANYLRTAASFEEYEEFSDGSAEGARAVTTARRPRHRFNPLRAAKTVFTEAAIMTWSLLKRLVLKVAETNPDTWPSSPSPIAEEQKAALFRQRVLSENEKLRKASCGPARVPKVSFDEHPRVYMIPCTRDTENCLLDETEMPRAAPEDPPRAAIEPSPSSAPTGIVPSLHHTSRKEVASTTGLSPPPSSVEPTAPSPATASMAPTTSRSPSASSPKMTASASPTTAASAPAINSAVLSIPGPSTSAATTSTAAGSPPRGQKRKGDATSIDSKRRKPLEGYKVHYDRWGISPQDLLIYEASSAKVTDDENVAVDIMWDMILMIEKGQGPYAQPPSSRSPTRPPKRKPSDVLGNPPPPKLRVTEAPPSVPAITPPTEEPPSAPFVRPPAAPRSSPSDLFVKEMKQNRQEGVSVAMRAIRRNIQATFDAARERLASPETEEMPNGMGDPTTGTGTDPTTGTGTDPTTGTPFFTWLLQLAKEAVVCVTSLARRH